MFLIPVYSAHLKPREYHIHLKNRCSCKHIWWDVELSPSGPIFSRTASNSLLVLKPLGLKCICSDEEYSKLLREKNTPHTSSFLPHSVSLRRKSHNRHTNKVWACFMCCGEKRLLGLKRNQSERRKCCVIVTRSWRGQQSTLSITSRAKCDTRSEIRPSFNKQIPLN